MLCRQTGPSLMEPFQYQEIKGNSTDPTADLQAPIPFCLTCHIIYIVHVQSHLVQDYNHVKRECQSYNVDTVKVKLWQ